MRSPDVRDTGAFALAEGVAVHGRRFRFFSIIGDYPISDAGKGAISNALDTNRAQN